MNGKYSKCNEFIKGKLMLVLGTIMFALLMSGIALAADSNVSDIDDHWAKEQIVDWIGKGLAQGYEDGNFQPEQKVTRAEFVALANRMYGYTERAAIGYSDVTDAWYAADVAKAAAAGYISGYQDHTFRPNESISRQEAAVMIASLLGLEQSGSGSISKFRDAAVIPSWSRNAIAAVVGQGYMEGYPDGTFRPSQSISRAEAIVALDQTAAMKIVTAGAYGPDRQTDIIHGNVVITSPNVTLQNVRIRGNLLLAQSIGEGDVTLNGVIVEGSTVVSGGGEHSVHVIDSHLFKVIVNKKTGSVRIVASGSTNVDQALLESGVTLEEEEITGAGFGQVTVSIDATTDNPIVMLSGNFTSVVIDTPDVSVQLQSGSITDLKVNRNASKTKITIDENANVSTLVLDARADVTGKGKVGEAIVNVNGSTFERKPEKLETAEGVTVEGNDPRTETTEPAANGNNGGNDNRNNGNGGSNGNGGNGAVKPTVVSVTNVADVEVVYGTTLADALSALEQTTTITDSEHVTHLVNLNWTMAGYDGNLAGIYTAIGVFALPVGVAQSNPPVSLEVTAKVTVKAENVPPVVLPADPTIVSVTYVPDIAVDYGTALADAQAALAQTTTVTDSVYAMHTVNLNWTMAGYDGNHAGVYTAIGTFALPAGVAQSNPPIPLNVTAKVTVKAEIVPPVVPPADPTIVSVTYVPDITVDFGTTLADAQAALAQTTTVTDSVYATHVVNLSWTIAGYDGNQAGDYTATGIFALPAGVVQANPPVQLEVTAKVTVKDVNILFASTSGDASEIVIGFGAPLAAPTSPAGLTVTMDGTPNPVVSTTLDTDPSKLRIGLTTRVPIGTVTVSYAPPGLETAGGSIVPTFINLAVPTAGSLAEKLKNDGNALDDIVDMLKAEGYSLVVVVQALQTNGYNVNEMAAALKTAQVPVDSAGAGLLYAGYTVTDVASVLIQVYSANCVTVATTVLPKADTADNLIALLASVGFTQPAELAQALYATNFTVAQASAALWSHFSGSPGQLGSALTGAGYGLSDAVAAVLGLNGGNNTAAVAAAWPGVFGDSGALVPVGTAAVSLRSANLPATETNALLVTLYTTYRSDPYVRASALKAGGYNVTDTARILKDFFGTSAGIVGASTDALYAGGYNPIEVALAIQTVFGSDAQTIATNVLPRMGISAPLNIIQTLQQAGFGDNDVVKAALSLRGNNANYTSPLLHLAGYTAEQVTAMLKPTLGASFNVAAVTQMLSSDMSGAGYYSAAEIASILQTVFGATAQTTGVEILKTGYYDLLEVAIALQGNYKIDGYDFIGIRNAYYSNKNLQLFSDLASSSLGEKWRLLYLMKDSFGMSATDVASALRGVARLNGGTPLITVINNIQTVYGNMTVPQKMEMMTLGGYNLAEIAAVVSSGLSMTDTVGYLHDAGYSAEAVAQYLLNYYGNTTASDSTTANLLISAGYGSCVNLEPVIITLRQVYGSTDQRMIEILTGSSLLCDIADVTVAIGALGGSADLPQYAVSALWPAPATQAVSLLKEVFAKSDALEIANILKQTGYNSFYTISALRSMLGLSPSDAKSVLGNVFGVTESGAVAKAMKEIGYAIADIVPLLGSNDPLVLAGYLRTANVDPVETLIQLFGPKGPFNDPLTLSKNLKALGVFSVQAVPIMQNFGYSPTEIGSLLWSNGYELPYVAAGVNQALAPVANEYWLTTVAKALKQMTTCTGSLANLPACSTGNSTFTYTQVVGAIAAGLGYPDLDCSKDFPLCYIMMDTMINAGYSVPTIAGTLYSDFNLSLPKLSAYLQHISGYTTPKQVVGLLKQAPFNTNAVQLANALRSTTFNRKDIHAELMTVSGSEKAAFLAMKDGGYSILDIIRVMGSYGADRSLIMNNLQALGYGHTEALNAVLTVYPITVEEWMGIVSNAAGWL